MMFLLLGQLWILLAVFPVDTVHAMVLNNMNIGSSSSENSRRRQLNHKLLSHRRQLDEAATDAMIYDESIQMDKLLPSTGTVKVLVVCVLFTDHADRILPKREDIELTFNGASGFSTATESRSPNVIASIQEYMQHHSDGKLRLEAEVRSWVNATNTEAYYANGEFGKSGTILDAVYPILDVADSDGIDFSQFDNDGDGMIDALIILHSGLAAEAKEMDCVHAVREDRIWSHVTSVRDSAWASSSGFRINGYMVTSGASGSCSRDPPFLPTLVHEMIHTFGIPDLYTPGPSDVTGAGVGYYDIMALYPPHRNYPLAVGAWTKIKLGWIEPIEIREDGDYFIEAGQQIFMINNGFSDGEYLLIENRQDLTNYGYTSPSGILIWHIDDNVDGNMYPAKPLEPGWRETLDHYQVAILTPNGDQKANRLEYGDPDISKFHFWHEGGYYINELGLGPSADTYPNTNSIGGGRIVETGIRIFNFSRSGNIMKFWVSGVPSPPPTSPTIPPSPSPTLAPTPFPVTTPSPTPWPTAFLPPPTNQPTPVPTTESPTIAPTTWPPTPYPTVFLPPPTNQPTPVPTTESPTVAPTTWPPTPYPTLILQPAVILQPVHETDDIPQIGPSLLGGGKTTSSAPPSLTRWLHYILLVIVLTILLYQSC